MDKKIFISLELDELQTIIIECVNSCLRYNRQEQPTELPEQLLTVQEAAQFLNLTVATIYSKVSKAELPVMKRGKRLYFSGTELMEYIKGGRKKSNAEIEAAAADEYLSKTK